VFLYYIHSYFAVTDDSSNQTKASVSKLRPEHLSLLVKQADMNLGHLYNLKNVKVQSAVSPENGRSHPEKENIVPVIMSESISSGRTHFTELSYDSCANISETEDLQIVNCKHEIPDNLGRSVDDPELKSEMEDLETAVLEHNNLVDELTCHGQGIEEELDTHAIEVMSAEEEFDESVVETMASVIPASEVPQVTRYV
jgi:hypothetical protein